MSQYRKKRRELNSSARLRSLRAACVTTLDSGDALAGVETEMERACRCPALVAVSVTCLTFIVAAVMAFLHRVGDDNK